MIKFHSLFRLPKKKISNRILALCLLLSLGPLLTQTLITYLFSESLLSSVIKDDLNNITSSKAYRIENYVRERKSAVGILARLPLVRETLVKLGQSFDHGKINNRAYQEQDLKFRKTFEVLAEKMHFDDLLLVTSDGDAVFSMRRREDFGSNFMHGPYQQSSAAKTMQLAAASMQAEISDFAYYQPANEPVAFVTSEILSTEGQPIGFILAQLNNSSFYSVVNETIGLGHTGETIIAAKIESNTVFLTPIRSDPDAAFRRKITEGSSDFKPLQLVAEGHEGYGPTVDHLGHQVIASWKFLPEMRWGLLVKIDTLEAFNLIGKQRIFLGVLIFLTVISILAGARALAKSIATPIVDLTEAVREASEGRIVQTKEIDSEDEVGDLTRSFNKMTDNLKGLLGIIRMKNDELTTINENLEKVVQERTATINTILNNVQTGFFLIDEKMIVREGYTKSCERLFSGLLVKNTNLAKSLGVTARQEGHLRVQIEQVFEDVLDEDFTLNQIPYRYSVNNTTLHLFGSTVRNSSGKVESILFTVTDATKLEQAETEGHLNKVLIHLLKQRDAFKNFVRELKSYLASMKRNIHDAGMIRRTLHTLKGNLVAYGLNDIGECIHKIEDETEIGANEINKIERLLEFFLDQNKNILEISYGSNESEEEVFQTKSHSLDELKKSVLNASSIQDVRSGIELWINNLKKKPAIELIGPLREYLESLAERSGKRIRLVIENENLLLDPIAMRPIFSILPHVTRNAIDHGIEYPTERKKKSPIGTLVISFFEDSGSWLVRISDDGTGINRAQITQRAVQLGIIQESDVKSMSEEEKLYLVFKEGVTSLDSANMSSGRGVGMGAVWSAVREVGGEVTLRSDFGVGTQIELKIPKTSSARNLNKDGNETLQRKRIA